MKIVYSGGGTLGPVTPLLAIHDVLCRTYGSDIVPVWVGTRGGPEREFVKKINIRFVPIYSGKLRRYVSFRNIFDIFHFFVGCLQSFVLLIREKPDFCISAGGFVSVPIHFAAWCLGIPTWIHQQDVRVGYANRLMAMWARIITTALEEEHRFFPKKKTRWLGNPVRQEVFLGQKERAFSRFQLRDDVPVVLVMGGGTGSARVNKLTAEAIPLLHDVCQVIHLTGRERPRGFVGRAMELFSYYHAYVFLDSEMADAYAIADIVVSRGGFGSIAEIAALSKPAIFIPISGSHQEENINFLVKADAALSLNERSATGNLLAATIKELLQNEEERRVLAGRIHALLPVAKEDDIIDVVNVLKNKKKHSNGAR